MQQQKLWHSQPSQTVADELQTDSKLGLSANDATIRQQRYGMNNITEHKGTGPIKRFIMQFHQPLVYILLAAVAVTMVLGEWVDSAVIFLVVLLNAVQKIARFLDKTSECISSLLRQTLTRTQVMFNQSSKYLTFDTPGTVMVIVLVLFFTHLLANPCVLSSAGDKPMKRFKKILVKVNEQTHIESDVAVLRAIELARTTGAKVMLFDVVEPLESVGGG